MNPIGAATRPGEGGASRRGDQCNLVLCLDHRFCAECDCRIADIGNHVDAIDIEPLADDAEPDIGLVLVVGDENFDLERGIGFGEFLDGLLQTGDAGWPLDVAIDA